MLGELREAWQEAERKKLAVGLHEGHRDLRSRPGHSRLNRCTKSGALLCLKDLTGFFAESFVEHAGQALRSLQIFRAAAFQFALQQVVFVGNVEGGQHG